MAGDRFGVAEHKAIKNEITTTGFYAHYKDRDFIGKRVRAKDKIVEVARPAAYAILAADAAETALKNLGR